LNWFFLILVGAGSASAQTLALMWDASPDSSVGGYFVYVGNQSRTYTTIVDVGSSTSFSLGHLPADQRYFLAVASYDRNGVAGAASEEVSWGEGPRDAQPEPIADTTAPIVTVTTPSTTEPVRSLDPYVVVGGVALDQNAIAAVEWKTNRGESGRATGTEAWLATIPLRRGNNRVTITARDAAGNKAHAVIVIRHRFGGSTSEP
jgi:fibronectin type 3 domain-containing protein